jgi:hypothetical protein
VPVGRLRRGHLRRSDPLSGPVYLVSPPGGGLPQLGIALNGLLPVKLRATVTFSPEGRVVSTLGGLPDVPLSSFTLVLSGGAKGLMTSVADLCATPSTIDASFTAQAGIERTASAPATAINCSNVRGASKASGGPRTGGRGPANKRPKVKAALSKAGSLVVVAAVPRGGSKLRRMKIALPKGLTADSAKRLRATRRTGARRIKVHVAANHLTMTRRKLASRSRVTVVATNAAGKTYRVRAKLRR